jgi:type III secretion protein O
MWRELLGIKEYRERQAETALLRERALLALAQRQREAAERTLDDYRDYALNHERALYADLMRRTVRLREIEAVQATVAQLRQEEERLRQAALRATEARDAAARRTDSARDDHRSAERMKEKFLHLANRHAAELLAEAERREEREFEEVSSLARDRHDWAQVSEEAA